MNVHDYLCVLLVPLALAVARPSVASVIYVNKNVSSAPNDGTSWSTAFNTVQAGMNAAASGDEVWVAVSTPAAPAYVENIALKPGVALYGGFAGTETQRNQRDWKTNVTILDGNSNGSVLTLSSTSDIPSTLDGFTIRNGLALYGSPSSENGGGLRVGGMMLVSNNIFMSNRASSNGGGVYVISGTVTLSGNAISGNKGGGMSGAGGGIYVASGDVVISGNTITGNQGYGMSGEGGGIDVHGGNVSIIGNSIRGNMAAAGSAYGGYGYGGGICILSKSGTVTVTGNSISGNSASKPDGGSHPGSGMGGGIYVGGNATVTGNVISGNKASSGGGSFSPGTAWGGGIYVSKGNPTIANNTIVGNFAGAEPGGGLVSAEGGGIYIGSDATIVNTIVAFNTSGVCWSAGTAILRSNDVYGNTSYDFSGLTNPTGANGNVSTDPLFTDRTGGDYHLGSGSPCIDAGDDSLVTPGQTDLDGRPRKLGMHVDIGAYEFATPGYLTLPDAASALGASGGLTPATDTRLNIDGALGVSIIDAVRLARKVAGLDANP